MACRFSGASIQDKANLVLSARRIEYGDGIAVSDYSQTVYDWPMNLVANASKEQLGECARILALNVAHYSTGDRPSTHGTLSLRNPKAGLGGLDDRRFRSPATTFPDVRRRTARNGRR
jgi:hypothetical protein